MTEIKFYHEKSDMAEAFGIIPERSEEIFNSFEMKLFDDSKSTYSKITEIAECMMQVCEEKKCSDSEILFAIFQLGLRLGKSHSSFIELMKAFRQAMDKAN